MSDEASKFKLDVFKKSLVKTVFNGLKERRDPNLDIVEEKLKTSVRGHIRSTVRSLGDAIPASATKDISLSASYLIILEYSELRINLGKTPCESLIGAQNYFVDFAYNTATEKVYVMKDNSSSQLALKKSAEYLKDAFGNFRAYTGGDAEKYALFLARVTRDVLQEIHPKCKGLMKIISSYKIDTHVNSCCRELSLPMGSGPHWLNWSTEI